MENDFIYTPSSTDITIRWRKVYGYVPASEQAKYQKKWADFRALSLKTLDDVDIPTGQSMICEHFFAAGWDAAIDALSLAYQRQFENDGVDTQLIRRDPQEPLADDDKE